MSKVIVYKRKDGRISIVVPSPNVKKSIHEIAKSAVPEGHEYRLMDEHMIPKDRYFRNAWTDDKPGPQIDINIDQAKEIHIDALRIERNRELEDLDTASLKALEKQDLKELKKINTKKQKLRDMPEIAKKEMKRLKKPESIKAYIPESMKGDS